MTKLWFAYVRRIKRNDYQNRKCAECSVKHRPAWANWSWWRLFWLWVAGTYPFFRLPADAKVSGFGYAPSINAMEQAAKENRLAIYLGDTAEECDHVFFERDPVVIALRAKLLGRITET